MNTVTGGYFYQSPVKTKKPLHTSRVRSTRIIILLVLFAASLYIGLLNVYATDGADAAASNEAGLAEVFYTPYSVQPGDTLWKIANHHAPKHVDIRSFIQNIKEVNHLQSSVLQVGQLLHIPTSH